ncbi:hypothetical protein BDW66DRAFT_160080 [Aspergillus desertorum]
MRLWKHDFRGRALVFAIALASCQAFLLLGFDQGVMSGLVGADNRFGRDFNNPDADMQGNITALYDIGCVLGSIVSYFVGERLGRRTMLMTGGGIVIVGTVILASSNTVAQLIVGRIVTGIENGMNSSTAPAVFAIFLVLQVIGLLETPRWLVQHDRHDEAQEVVAAITDVNDPDVLRTILDIQVGLEEEEKGGPFKFKELFTWGEEQNLRRLLLIISVELGQQFTGSNMINYYGPVMFQTTMNMGRNLSMILGGAIQCTYLVGSAIPVLLMDRFGRRTLLMVCSLGLCFCFIMVSILLSLRSTNAAYGATAFIFIFQLFYGIGWLPVPWFYPSETSTTRTRTRMQAIASGWNWMAVFAVVKITPLAFQNIGWRTFIIFAVLNAAFIPMVYFFYPETEGLELEDIPLLFSKGGFTGGVFSSKGGRTVMPEQHAVQMSVDRKVETVA